MKAIICGAGQVGSSIVRELASEGIDITVIDQRADLIRKIGDVLDVRAMVGHAAHPSVLEAAGARDCDMIIAVTFADEVNMVACQIAHSLFDVPTKIARLRARDYLEPIWSDLFSRDNMPIDVIISPEVEVARAIGRRLTVPGAVDMIPLADNKLRLLGIRCASDCPILNTPLRQLTTLFPDLKINTVGIVRDNKPIIASGDDELFAGDEVYLVVASEHVARTMVAFGHEEPEARRVVLIGGGNIGLCLAEDLANSFSGVATKLIELNRERAEFVAQTCPKTVVLNGDALDPEILEEANVSRAETVIAVTNDDEVNILASLLAKRYGAGRAITLVNSGTYAPLMAPLGIDVVVSPRAITVSTILQYVRRGRIRSVHAIADNFGEIIEVEALETSSVVGMPLREAKLPTGVVIAAVVRDDEIEMARGSTVIGVGDLVVLFAAKGAVKRVEKMFSVSVDFF